MSANLKHTIEESSQEDVQIVHLSGEIDESNQEALESIMEGLLSDANTKNIVFNIENLDYINSGVIGVFAGWYGTFTENDKMFVFAQANDNIFDIIDLVGLTSIVDHFPTIEEACLSFEN